MASNRRAEPETEKRAHLVATARALFIAHGYDATPMTRIAQTAGVAPNTIYWYFTDKDALLIAVLDDVLADTMRSYTASADSPLQEQLLWIVTQLRQVSRLVAALHNRLAASTALKTWHDDFHARLEHLIALQLCMHTAIEDAAMEARIAAYTFEGLMTHDDDEDTARRACAALARRWQAAR